MTSHKIDFTPETQVDCLTCVIAHSPDGMAFLNADLIIKTANRVFARQVNSTMEKVVGQSAKDVVPGWQEHFAKEDWSTKSTPLQVVAGCQNSAMSVPNDQIYWEWNMSPICGVDGRFWGWLLTQRAVMKSQIARQAREILYEQLSDKNSQLTLSNLRTQQYFRQAEIERAAAQKKAVFYTQLQHVTAALSAAVTLADVIDVIVTKGVSAVKASAGGLVVLDPITNTARLVNQQGFMPGADEVWGEFLLTAENPLAAAMRRGKPLFYEYKVGRPSMVGLETINPYAQAFAAVPLMARCRVLGALALCFFEPHEFTQDHQDLLNTLAKHCAQALERAGHHDELEMRVVERTGELARANAYLRQEIIERQRVQEELAQAQQEKDLVQTRMIQTAAHELRNPMAAVKGICSLLLRRVETGKAPVDLPQKLSILQREIDRLADLVNELLEAFRAQRGFFSANMKQINLIEVIKVALVTHQAGDDGQHFQVDGLQQSPVWVYGDPDRLEDVLRNLLSNAVKYSSPDNRQVRLTLKLSGDKAVVMVKDNGMGIPADQLERIFSGFFRASNVLQSGPGGLGLGLRICRDIIEQHRGRIWAESELNRGAVFYVELPLLSQPYDPL